MNPVPLITLDPVLKGTYDDGLLVFDCPIGMHKVRVHLGKAPAGEHVWKAEGKFPEQLTVSPSINETTEDGSRTVCWHGNISNGMVTFDPSSVFPAKT